MVLTNERAEMLAKYLTDKKEVGYNLLDLDASEAVVKINADGFDFTSEELHDFADMMEDTDSISDELDEDTLVGVNGGISTGAFITAFRCGYYVYMKSRQRRW